MKRKPKLSSDVVRSQSDPEHKYRVALQTTGFGLWDYNLETGETVWDDVTKACFGVDVEGPVPVDAGLSLIHPDDRDHASARLQKALDPSSGGDYSVEKRIIRPAGQVRWIRTTGRTIFEGTGESRKAVRVIGTVQDITKEKKAARAEQYLVEAGVRLASTLDYSETLRDVATVARRIFADYCVISIIEQDGFDEQRELGTEADDSEDIVRFLQEHPFFDPAANNFPAIQERRSLLISGPDSEPLATLNAGFQALNSPDEFIKSLIAVPLAPRGQFLGYMWFLCTNNCDKYDDSDLVLAEQLAVRAALAADNARLYTTAQKAIQARDELQAVIVHDLRNPVTVLRGMEAMLELALAEGRVDREGLRRHVRTQQRAIDQMDHLIKNLHDAASLEAGTYRLECQPEAPSSLVEEALDLARFRSKKKNLEVDSHVEADLPDIWGDRQALARVAANLVHNAVKFTPSNGQIAVSASQGEDTIEFRVSDSGPGIPEEMVPHIFERYWQARRGQHRGSGLGLSIAREIVEAHEGRMWVEDTSEDGTTIAFAIPIAS
jgi:K+-sensing histidine kinase KdpD